MRRFTASIIIVFILLPIVTYGIERVGTTVFQVLKINVGVRGIGMGNAFIAGANDVSAIYWNPAGLSLMSRPEALISHINLPADVNYDLIGFAWPAGNSGTFAVSAGVLHMDDMVVRTPEMPDGTGELFTASDVVFAASYSKAMSTLFSFGVTAKYVREDLYNYVSQGVVFDAGLVYQTGFRSMKLAMVISNFGPDSKFDGSYQDWRTVSGEVSGEPDVKNFEGHLMPMSFRVGVFADMEVMTGVSLGESFSGNLGLQFEHPSDVAERLNAGVEFWFQQIVAFRGGYNFNYDTENLTLGLGVKKRIGDYLLNFDYAYAGYGDLTDTSSLMNQPHRFSIGFQF